MFQKQMNSLWSRISNVLYVSYLFRFCSFDTPILYVVPDGEGCIIYSIEEMAAD